MERGSADARRRFPRYAAKLTVVVLFDPVEGRPTLHAVAYDASAGGIAVESRSKDLSGTVTLIVVPAVAHRSGRHRTLRFRARVVWHRELRRRLRGRRHLHGLEFLDHGSDDPAEFARHLAPASGAPESTVEESVAAARVEDDQRPPLLACNDALRRAYDYLSEFAAQQTIARPGFPRDRYRIVRLPPFDGMVWRNGGAFLRTRELAEGGIACMGLDFHYELGSETVIEAVREAPENERLRAALVEHELRFAADDRRSRRGPVERTSFDIACAVQCRLSLTASEGSAELQVLLSNVGGFGVLRAIAYASDIDAGWLDGLADYMLGHARHPVFLSRIAFRADTHSTQDSGALRLHALR